MADFTALKTTIQQYIKQNGNEEITGNILQEVLLAMVQTMGDGTINDLVTALSNEVTNRQNADGTLQNNITAEATARGDADGTLQNNITAEATARGDADTALGGRLTTVEGAITAINTKLAEGYIYAGIATPSTNPGTISGKVFYIAVQAGTYTNLGGTVVTEGITILKYNGTSWVKEQALFTDGGVFDISAYHATGGTLAKYVDLAEALNGGANIPQSLQKGGMSVKFVQSSDNKYIQARCMAQNFTTDVAQWQGVDDIPTTGSDNLVKSGGVKKYIGGLSDIVQVLSSEFAGMFWGGDKVYAATSRYTGYVIELEPGASYTWAHGINPVTFTHQPLVGDRDGISVSQGFIASNTDLYLLLTVSAGTPGTSYTKSKSGVVGDVQDYVDNLVAEKYTKPDGGIPETDTSAEFQHYIDFPNIIMGGEPAYKSFTSEDYMGFIMDESTNRFVSVSPSGTFNSVLVRIYPNCKYEVSNAFAAYIVQDYPVTGFTVQYEKVTDKSNIVVAVPSYMSITVYASVGGKITSYSFGYVNLSEFGKRGIAFGDSNMDARGISVGGGDDVISKLNKIMGSIIYNAGIGGTTYYDRALAFTRITQAIVNGNWTQVDSDLESLVQENPSLSYLTTVYATIKTLDIHSIDFAVVAYGTNDWSYGQTINDPTNLLNPNTILGGLRIGIQTLLNANPKLRIYVITPAYRYNWDGNTEHDSDNTAKYGRYLYQIADAIYNCCHDELHIPCLNYYYTSGLNKYSRGAILNSGGTHRTVYGYELMAQQYAKFILSY